MTHAAMPQGTARSQARRLDSLQAGRMVAAILVVLYHANDFILPMRLYDGVIIWRGFGMGYAGVEFFFVLSGFIMAHVHAGDFGRPGRLRAFLNKRFTRIYPVYWVVLGGLVALYLAASGLAPDARLDPRSLLNDFLLFPSPERPLLPVAWTLKHEIMFYLLFGLFIVNVRLALAIFAIWVAGCFLQMVVALPGFPATFILSPYNVLFVMGILVARFHHRVPARATGPLLLAGLTGFLLVGMTEQFVTPWNHALRTLAYGISAGSVVTALARGDIAVPGWSVFLGNASYAIYLTHLPALNMLAVPVAMAGLQAHIPPLVMFVLLTVFAVAVGAAFHIVVEKPLMALLARRRHAASRAAGERQGHA